MSTENRDILLRTMLLALFLYTPANADNSAAGTRPPAVIAQCNQCHGQNGDSTSGSVPRLNGQQAQYLEARLNALRYPVSQTPKAIHAMWDLANHIGDDDIPIIAKYYAGQAATPALRRRDRLAQEGKTIYERGAFEDVPVCQRCHGSAGEGRGTTPRLAGQHAQYLQDQLLAFVLTLRPHPAMSVQNKFLTDPQTKALAAYLAGP